MAIEEPPKQFHHAGGSRFVKLGRMVWNTAPMPVAMSVVTFQSPNWSAPAMSQVMDEVNRRRTTSAPSWPGQKSNASS